VRDAKPGQIALAWLLQKGDGIVPISDAKPRQYLEENVAAGSVKLEAHDVKVLDTALDAAKISGKRYFDWIMATVDR
jgi:aryl-alcohol dehydrogenase-like predicted oxidoreductase